ncbi:TetR/AcrR family transcriptional regulator [Phytomonospora endophytica]|uniref:AcrR family transcriptional regulator n=1 Tax=Phytomonospora endophytica TaxID=714109 RepID=A0A841FB96_9ACTN|nr:TetR family transcriptional regulator [Phytomonospora endophytica]MBB6032575.1 AcrR family transcriptional regulator [Phytomonospora endophytica]GIG66275.1 TetR family transcriptional regulator [Phytomonospora endophytica]
MTEELSLRERKKRETGRIIWTTALAMFRERGFDAVSVKEIADAVSVSKMTVFNYFPTKEDLVMHPMAEHIDEPMRVVRDRPSGVTPHAAFRAHFIAALRRFDAATGLNAKPLVRDIQQLVTKTPTLMMRMLAYNGLGERMLADQLVSEGATAATAEIMAGQIMATRNVLIHLNRGTLDGGRAPAEVLPEAIVNAERAFDLLENGLGDLFARP